MSEPLLLPVVPLRDAVLFPGLAMPITAGRPGTLRAIEAGLRLPQHRVVVLTQRQNLDDVNPEGLHTLGTVARLGGIQRHQGGMQLVLHGEARAAILRIEPAEGYLRALVSETSELGPDDPTAPQFVALFRETQDRALELAKRVGLPDELVQQLSAQAHDPGRFADLVAAFMELTTPERQQILEVREVEERLRQVLLKVERQIAVLEAQEEIKTKVQEELGDRQREAILREQIRAIRKELGEGDDDREVDELEERLAALDLPPAARKEADRELSRLRRIGRESMESQVIRTYLETLAELPWNKRSEEKLDIAAAAQILEEDHYGLQDVKDRVLEFLAVRKLRQQAQASTTSSQPPEHSEPQEQTADAELAPPEKSDKTASTGSKSEKSKGPILLFVGPPGVGKTSIARSIARAMGREYVRISLGGARDEADIRGHRRTYVGAMPGRILQGMKQAGTKNPVFLLDEVDKLGVSFQGDPAAALLEVLDPAQNDTFVDHYLGVQFDLSEVLFIATANFIQQIPSPLLDRMEAVEFSGYTEAEKREIARRFLIPRQLKENGLTPEQLQVEESALDALISGYTREAGVRQLERELGRLARKVARKVAAGELEKMAVAAAELEDLLGRPKVHPERAAAQDQIGVATGMFYTPVGGDILFVEASTMRGKGELVLTGQLGDVMKESARAAWSYARSHARELGIPIESFECDVHIHVPSGAVPKDGPSAGVTLATALTSALASRPVRHDLAMTGEITLTGRVLPVGGLKEKILGSVRAGISEFILPKPNLSDLEDLPADVRARIVVHPVEHLGEVLALALRGAALRDGKLMFSQDLVAPPRTTLGESPRDLPSSAERPTQLRH